MEILPLPKRLYDRAVKLSVTEINLKFSGGSDEAYLSVYVSAPDKIHDSEVVTLSNDIESWAEDAYDYGGSGDGHDYGDDITYNLQDMTTSHTSWYTTIADGEGGSGTLEIEPESNESE